MSFRDVLVDILEEFTERQMLAWSIVSVEHHHGLAIREWPAITQARYLASLRTLNPARLAAMRARARETDAAKRRADSERARIDPQFAEAVREKQRRYRARRKAAGICRACVGMVHKAGLCAAHYETHKLAQRKRPAP